MTLHTISTLQDGWIRAKTKRLVDQSRVTLGGGQGWPFRFQKYTRTIEKLKANTARTLQQHKQTYVQMCSHTESRRHELCTRFSNTELRACSPQDSTCENSRQQRNRWGRGMKATAPACQRWKTYPGRNLDMQQEYVALTKTSNDMLNNELAACFMFPHDEWWSSSDTRLISVIGQYINETKALSAQRRQFPHETTSHKEAWTVKTPTRTKMERETLERTCTAPPWNTLQGTSNLALS